MNRRVVRVLLVLVFAGVAATAAWQALARSKALDAAAERRLSLAAVAADADRALVELAAAERGYVAPGQGIDFWTSKADEALISARGALSRIGAGAVDPAAAPGAAALSRLEDFAVVDERARALSRDGQRSAAADLIFADGYEILASARAELASAVAREQAAAVAPAALDRQIQLASIAALGAVAVLALLMLLRAPKEPELLVTTLGDAGLVPAVASDFDQELTPRAIPDDGIGAALDASLAGLDTLEPVVPLVPAVPQDVALSDAADVCVDLARLLDARDLDAVLARAASVLGASGMIVWMADEAGQSMAPALTHGYPSSLVARLGQLATGDDNATAAAWRARSAQVVDGALAVPLLTSLGCTGVLALEFRDGREQHAERQALARILAAQLAASISPATTESRRAAGG